MRPFQMRPHAPFFRIFGNVIMNMIVQQTAAVASAILSAANTPLTPQRRGRISASGMRRMTFLRRAMNSDIEVNMDAT